METFINDDAINLVALSAKKLLERNKLEETFKLLEENIPPISGNLSNAIILLRSQYYSLEDNIIMGVISPENAMVARSTIILNTLNFLNQIPKNVKSGELKTGIYKTTSNENLEKILGPLNHLVKISWLHRGIQVSKSVCQVLRADEGKGTGFVLKGGYLLTNFHVLPNKKQATSAKIIFNYEEDLLGNLQKTSEYYLDPSDAKFSPVHELDYAYIKIKDNPSNQLSQWGQLDVDTFSEPQINSPVTIIQHPLGQTKQIALTANTIVGIDKNKLFYQTDTERGSSGSPVFNDAWKVIALHHAGKTEEDGGLVINPKTGERRGANEGILIKKIVKHIGKSI